MGNGKWEAQLVSGAATVKKRIGGGTHSLTVGTQLKPTLHSGFRTPQSQCVTRGAHGTLRRGGPGTPDEGGSFSEGWFKRPKFPILHLLHL